MFGTILGIAVVVTALFIIVHSLFPRMIPHFNKESVSKRGCSGCCSSCSGCSGTTKGAT